MKKNAVAILVCLFFLLFQAVSHAETGEKKTILETIDAFRKTLSSPGADDIRKGNIVNRKVLAEKIVVFGKENGNAIRGYQENIFDGMKKKNVPSEESYTRICIADAAGNDELMKMIDRKSVV